MPRPNALVLFRAGAGLLLVCALILGFSALHSAYVVSRTADASLEKLRTFEAAFSAFTAIGVERQSTEAFLARDPGALGDEPSRLAADRLMTDVALETFQRRAARDGLAEHLNFSFLKAQLREMRQRADVSGLVSRRDRRLGEQVSIVRGLISVGETAQPFVSAAAKRIIANDPDLAGQVNMARLLGALYESAIRLPSEVMPSVANGEVIPPELVSSAMRTEQRIFALWDVGASQLEFDRAGSALEHELAAIRQDYFGKGLPFLTRLIERQSKRVIAVADPMGVFNVYRPTTKPIARLRDLQVEQMISDAKERQHSALINMLVTLVLTTTIIGAVPMLVWIAYRQVLRPLLEFRSQILAICDQEERARRPYEGTVPQLQGLYRALETLWDRETQRAALDQERAALAQRLRTLSETDQLTGLLNRRGLTAALPRLEATQKGLFALMLIDIDHFKTINDTHGHGVGDCVLERLGSLLAQNVPSDAASARYGGEEFAVALTATEMSDVLDLAERLRGTIEEASVESAGLTLRITASFGVAFCDADELDWAMLIAQADEALYVAKAAGRNRVRARTLLLQKLDTLGNRGEAGVRRLAV